MKRYEIGGGHVNADRRFRARFSYLAKLIRLKFGAEGSESIATDSVRVTEYETTECPQGILWGEGHGCVCAFRILLIGGDGPEPILELHQHGQCSELDLRGLITCFNPRLVRYVAIVRTRVDAEVARNRAPDAPQPIEVILILPGRTSGFGKLFNPR